MGTTVNNLVNCARDWGQKCHPDSNQSQGLVKRFVAPRATMAAAAICNAEKVAENIFRGAMQTVGFGLKLPIKPISWISGSETIKNFENKFPGLSDILKTVARVVAHTIGVFAAAAGAVISPRAAIYLHDKLGLSADKRAAVLLAETKNVPAAPCCQSTVVASATPAVAATPAETTSMTEPANTALAQASAAQLPAEEALVEQPATPTTVATAEDSSSYSIDLKNDLLSVSEESAVETNTQYVLNKAKALADKTYATYVFNKINTTLDQVLGS